MIKVYNTGIDYNGTFVPFLVIAAIERDGDSIIMRADSSRNYSRDHHSTFKTAAGAALGADSAAVYLALITAHSTATGGGGGSFTMKYPEASLIDCTTIDIINTDIIIKAGILTPIMFNKEQIAGIQVFTHAPGTNPNFILHLKDVVYYQNYVFDTPPARQFFRFSSDTTINNEGANVAFTTGPEMYVTIAKIFLNKQ